MKRERIKKKGDRSRDHHLELPPLSAREIFYPYPIRREPPSERSR
jgi:hypothetical protein